MNATMKRPAMSRYAAPLPLTVEDRNIQTIQTIVADYYGHHVKNMTDPGRAEPVATIRQVAMALSRQLLRADLANIARAFGRKEHGTISHAIRSIADKSATDPLLKNQVAEIRNLVAMKLKITLP